MMQIKTRLFERQGMSGVEIEALVADIKKDIS